MTQLMRTQRPGDPLEAVRREMEALLGYAPQLSSQGRLATAWFPIDLVETAEGYELAAEVPGVSKEDIQISLQGNVLTISVTKRACEESEGESVHVRERVFGEFARSVSLPVGIDADNVTATWDNGVLTVRIPKVASSKPRQIQIAAE
jgi:HSP20 family protein